MSCASRDGLTSQNDDDWARATHQDAGGTMAKLTLDISMSLDGFIAGPNQTLDEPLGKGGDQLHEWAFAARSWRESHGYSGGEANVDSEVIEESLRSTGATVWADGCS